MTGNALVVALFGKVSKRGRPCVAFGRVDLMHNLGIQV